MANLTFIKVAPTLLQVTWDEPEVVNGIIQVYSVTVLTRVNSVVFNTNVAGDQQTVLITSLCKLKVFIYRKGETLGPPLKIFMTKSPLILLSIHSYSLQVETARL